MLKKANKKSLTSKAKTTADVDVKAELGNAEIKPYTSTSAVKEGQIRIGLSKGLTLNLGNYQSARLEAWGEVVVPNTPKSYEHAVQSLSERLDAIIDYETKEVLKGD